MSTCISRHGEYSDHEPGDWCPRCGVFNEEAIVAERDRLRACVEAIRADIPTENPELIEAGYAVPAEQILATLAEHLGTGSES